MAAVDCSAPTSTITLLPISIPSGHLRNSTLSLNLSNVLNKTKSVEAIRLQLHNASKKPIPAVRNVTVASASGAGDATCNTTNPLTNLNTTQLKVKLAGNYKLLGVPSSVLHVRSQSPAKKMLPCGIIGKPLSKATPPLISTSAVRSAVVSQCPAVPSASKNEPVQIKSVPSAPAPASPIAPAVPVAPSCNSSVALSASQSTPAAVKQPEATERIQPQTHSMTARAVSVESEWSCESQSENSQSPSEWEEELDEAFSLPDLGDMELDDEYLDMLAGEADEGECGESLLADSDPWDIQLDASSNGFDLSASLLPDINDNFAFPSLSFPFAPDAACTSTACLVPSSQPPSPSQSRSFSPEAEAEALLPSSSSSESGSSHEAGAANATCPSTPSLPTTPAPMGQMTFHCARCSIVYLSLEQMEKHIQTFHLRHCRNFQLDMDNVDTWVHFVWEPAASSSINIGFVRRPLDNIKSLSVPKTFPQTPMPSPTGLISDMDYPDLLDEEMSDDADSDWDLFTPTNSPSFKFSNLSLTERIEMEMPGPLKLPAMWPNSFEYKRRLKHTGRPRKNLKAHRRSKLSTRKPLRASLLEASRHVDWMVANVSKLIKEKGHKSSKKLGRPKATQHKVPTSQSPVSVIHKQELREKDAALEASMDGSVLPRKRIKKNTSVSRKGTMRKCRGVYGIHNQSAWCNMCKWKKRCSRFGEDAENEQNASRES